MPNYSQEVYSHARFTVVIDGPADIWSLVNKIGDEKLGEIYNRMVALIAGCSVSVGSVSVCVVDVVPMDGHIEGNGFEIDLDIYVKADANAAPDMDEAALVQLFIEQWLMGLSLQIGALSITASDLGDWNPVG